ncbi:secretin receptor [Hippocampus comes]|nr:PREDICTED: secretin receptor-like [Hippocampus comes]
MYLDSTMTKAGLVGVLLIPQATWSLSCHPHVQFMKEEERCMEDLQRFRSESNMSVNCHGMWDDLNCWPPASLGETVSQPCPQVFNAEGKVYRNCTSSGWTDLLIPHEDACGYIFNETLLFLSESPDSHLYFSYVKMMYTTGYALSLISLILAITILCLFRKLHCTRNHIHIQLFISFILKAVFIFLRDSLLFKNEELYHCDYYPMACKVALMLSNYSILANYNWLLVEGHFLFTLVSCFLFSPKKHLAWYILLSWGLPVIVIFSWGCAKYSYENEGCWETRRHEWIWWILRVPVLLTIFMNLLFFLGILRILLSKLRMPDAQGNEFRRYKKFMKSTFFLVVLFGLQYVLFVFLPVEVSSLMFKIWTFVELALSSVQGFVVALLYAFMNGEVQHEIWRRWKRWRLIQHLPEPSQSRSPQTQLSLLPGSPVHLAASGRCMDAAHFDAL